MAGKLTDAGGAIALSAAFGVATQSSRTMYLCLLTAAPGDATTLTTMTEVSYTGYARQTITMSTPSGSPATCANTNSITFPQAGSNPAEITHWGIGSAASGTSGDLVAYGTWDTPRDGAQNDAFSVAIGAVSYEID